MSRRDFQIMSDERVYIYILKYMLAPPRSTFCILLFSQGSTRKLLAQLKRKTEKNRKNKKTKKQKHQKNKNNKKNPEGNARPEFPQSLCFFGVFRFTVASDIFLKQHFPLPAFGIHYFPKKTAFPKIFPAIYFKLLSLKTGRFQREVASREESSI